MVGFRGWTPWEVGSLNLAPALTPEAGQSVLALSHHLGNGAPPTQEPRPGWHTLQGREYRRKTPATRLGLSLQAPQAPVDGCPQQHSKC